MNGLTFDEGPQLRPQRLVGDEIDRSPEQILQKELDPEVTIRRGGTIEGHQDAMSLSARAESRTVEPNRAKRSTP